MTVRDKQTLKGYFTDGNSPNQEEYADLIDSLIDGTQLGVDFSKILLIIPSTFTITEYPVTSDGFESALTASSSDDEIWIPPTTISGDHTIPEDVTIHGLSRRYTILSGLITLSPNSRLDNLRCIGGSVSSPGEETLVVDSYTENHSVTIQGDGTRHVSMDTSSSSLYDEHTWGLYCHVEPQFGGPRTIYWKISGDLTCSGGVGDVIEIANSIGGNIFLHADDFGLIPSMAAAYDGVNEFGIDQWGTCLCSGGGQAYSNFLAQYTFNGHMEFSLDPWDILTGILGIIGPDSGKAIISNCDVVVSNDHNLVNCIYVRNGNIDIIDSYLNATTVDGQAYCTKRSGDGQVQIFHSRLHGETDWFDTDDIYVYSVVEGGSDV